MSGCSKRFRNPSEAINHKVIVTCANCLKPYNSCIQSLWHYHNDWVSDCQQVEHTTLGLVLCNAGGGYWACHPHLHNYPGTEFRVTEPGTPSSPGLYPVGVSTITINGEEMVDTAPGDTVDVNLVMPDDKGYSLIYWYLEGDLLPNSPTRPSGSDIETEVSYDFSMPMDASGVYTFKAYIYPHTSSSDGEVYEYIFKIYCD